MLIQEEPSCPVLGLVKLQVLEAEAFSLTSAQSSCPTLDPHGWPHLGCFFEEISWEEQEWETFFMILQEVETAPILLAKEVQEELGDPQFASKEILRKKNIGLPI